jgi:RecA/RadA recombinase
MTQKVERKITPKKVKEKILARSECEFSERVEFLPVGCSNLHLVSSGRINDGGFPRARVINLVGDGSSGKTLIALEFMAANYYRWKEGRMKATENFPATKRLILIYNNVEGVMDFNIERMYGADFYDSVEWISLDTVEAFGADFFGRLLNIKKGDTIIYVVDSWDAMDSKEDKEKFDKNIKKMAQGKKPDDAGSYELGKQKYASKRFFKKVCADVQAAEADMTLVIISQVRQKIGVTFGEKRYRAGGDALNFYTHIVIWLAEKKKLRMTRLGQERVYGIDVRARVKRSKVWKPFREIDLKIIFDYGIDDVQSMMDFYFGPQKPDITWLDQKYKRQQLVDLFHEDSEQFEMLKIAVQEIWDEVERRTSPTRRKYECQSPE